MGAEEPHNGVSTFDLIESFLRAFRAFKPASVSSELVSTFRSSQKQLVSPKWRCRHPHEKADGPPCSPRLLIKYHDIPREKLWLKDNEFIVSGYRYSCCCKESLSSLFYLHNEWGNVWTHLLGFFLGLGLLVYSMYARLKGMDFTDKMLFLGYFGSLLALYLASSMFHLFMSVSHSMFDFFSRLDYLGILCHLVGACIPAIYYEFACDSNWYKLYKIMYLVAGSVVMLLLHWPAFNTPPYRSIRAATFIAIGALYTVPYWHKVVAFGFSHPEVTTCLPYYLTSALIYAFGAILFATRFPERLSPGKFDVLFHSHQLFHILTIVGGVVFYEGLVNAYFWRQDGLCISVNSPTDAFLFQ